MGERYVGEYADNRARHQARREHVDSIKLERGCMDCPPGTVWPAVALDFDHVRGTKERPISKLKVMKMDRLLAEIAKCDVVCANHHRIRTFAREWRRRYAA